MKRIIIANTAGFCGGVARSVALAEKALAERGEVWCLGELIHNRDEVERLESAGMHTARTVDEIPDGAAVIIRAHGVGRAEHETLAAKSCTVIDGTCVKVAKVHRIAEAAAQEGRELVIIGDETHPEVMGIAGWSGAHRVFAGDAELEKWLSESAENREKPISAVFQTTQTQKFLKKAKNNKKVVYKRESI